MPKTGDPDTALLAGVARARATDGNGLDRGLERVVRMAQSAALVHEATNIGAIRPDLADEDVDFRAVAAVNRARTKAALIRPTGPVFRLTKRQIVKRRMGIGLS